MEHAARTVQNNGGFGQLWRRIHCKILLFSLEIPPNMSGTRRFRVGLSFPGEKRDYVRRVAETLVGVLGRESVLYDEYLTAELARPNLDLYLGKLYREETDLLVPFLCAEYERKKWCNLEWRQIRDLLFDLNSDQIMLLRFDDAPVAGILSIDGYVMVGDRQPQAIAELILERLNALKNPVSSMQWLSQIKQPDPLVFWNVPYAKNPYFTGREGILVSLREKLEISGRAALTQALTGMGGIGKTQTAVEYAYRYREHYRAIMWVAADTETTIKTSLVGICTSLGLVQKDDPDHNQAAEAVKHWCDTTDHWLLIFDNADHPQLLKSFLPVAPRGHILLTSRAHVLDSLGISKPLDLIELPPDEAVFFLFTRTNRERRQDTEEEEAFLLAKELGYLPLALEQAAAFIMTHETRFQDYLTSYKKRRLALLGESKPTSGNYPASVETTWAMNFADIDTVSKAAADVLRVSSFLAPENIPIEIFIEGGSELGENIANCASQAIDDPVVKDKLFEPLTRYSLIRKDIGSHTYTIHRLVQTVIRQSLKEDLRRQWALRTTRALNKIFPSGSYDTWNQCERLVAHGATIATLVEEYKFRAEDAKEVVNSVACYLRMRGDFRESERIHLQSVALRERDLGPDHREVATALNNLSLVYTDRFEFAKAEPLLIRSLKIMQATADEDVSLGLNNLGMCYVRSRKYEEARPLLEEALALEEKSSKREEFFYAVILNNAAELELGLGNIDRAFQLCQEGLRLREEIGNPEKLGRSYITMAGILLRKDEESLAEEFFKKALRNREAVFGSLHPELILTLRRYSAWLKSRSRQTEAFALENRISDICRRYEIALHTTEFPNIL